MPQLFSHIPYQILFLQTILLFLPQLIFSQYIDVKIFPEPLRNQYSHFDFVFSENLVFSNFFLFSVIDSHDSAIFYPILDQNYVENYWSIFPEFSNAASQSSSDFSSPCHCFNPEDSNRIYPTHCGSISQDKAVPSTVAFKVIAPFIPAQTIVSCLASFNTQNGPKATIPLSLTQSDPPGWFLINKVLVFPYNPDKYLDKLSFVELSLSYMTGDIILAGERLDYLSFTLENLPANVILPLSLGFDSGIEKHLDRIYYLNAEALEYIANLWGALKPGSASTRSVNFTPDDDAFYQQSFDIPSPSCGFDVRIVFSRSTLEFSLATGDKPANVVVCTIPIPIFYIHAQIALLSSRQKLELWTDTPIISYLSLNQRLFRQDRVVGDPKWWYNGNPHLLSYSSQISTTVTHPSPTLALHEYEIKFFGPSPSFSFHQFYSHPDEPLESTLFTFGYLLSPTSHDLIPLELNTKDMFGHVYSFENEYTGYLVVRFSIPLSDHPHSVEIQTHQPVIDFDQYYPSTISPLLSTIKTTETTETNATSDTNKPRVMGTTSKENNHMNTKLLKAGRKSPWSTSCSAPSFSDSHITYEFVVSFQDPKSSTTSTTLTTLTALTASTDPALDFMVPFDLELTHNLPVYEFRPADKLPPETCTIKMIDVHTQEPYTPPQKAIIRIEQNPFLAKNFSDDISYFIRVDNIRVTKRVKTTITCTYSLLSNLPKPPPNLFNFYSHADICYRSPTFGDSGHSGCLQLKERKPIDGNWTSFDKDPCPVIFAIWTATSSKPITSQESFDQFLDTIVSILKEARLYVPNLATTHDVSPFLDWLTKDMFRDAVLSYPFPLSPSYSKDTTYPLSFSPKGWDTTTPFSIDSLSINSNGAVLSFTIHPMATEDCQEISTSTLKHLIYTPRNGVLLTQQVGSYGINLGVGSLSSPLLYQNESYDQTPQPYPGRKPGGASCYSHSQCWGFSWDLVQPNNRFSPYRTCLNGFCTTSSPSLTPHEFRLFNSLMGSTSNLPHDQSLLFFRSSIYANTAYDYIPPISQPWYKTKFVIILALLAIIACVATGFIIFLVIKSRKQLGKAGHHEQEIRLLDGIQ